MSMAFTNLRSMFLISLLVIAAPILSRASLVKYQWVPSQADGTSGNLTFDTADGTISSCSFGVLGGPAESMDFIGNKDWMLATGGVDLIPTQSGGIYSDGWANTSTLDNLIMTTTSGENPEMEATIVIFGQGQYNSTGVWTPAAVPEPSTAFAGALLMLPFGVSTMRMLRMSRKA